jgi:hypothetical protein
MNLLFVVLLTVLQTTAYTTEDSRGDGTVVGMETQPLVSRASLPSMPGWPITMTTHPDYAPTGATMADLDGNGIMEIMAGSTSGEFKVWDINGDSIWVKTGLGMIQSKPAIGDIDLDGDKEIVVTNRTNAIYIWESNGADFPGWPQYVSEVSGLKSPVLFDLNGDDTLEIIVGERDWPNGRIDVYSHNGSLLWFDTLDYMCVATPSVGDIDNDGIFEIVAASYYSLYAWDANGNLEPNWPLTIAPAGGMSYSQPTLVDLDGDDDLEIAITYYDWNTSDDYLGIWHHDATPFPGWPQTLWGGQSYGTPVPVDVDFDATIELSDASSHYMTNGPLHLFSSAGIEEPGWPFYYNSFLEGTPIAFDFDDDGYCELLVANNSTPGELYVLNYNGTQVPGAPFDMQAAFIVNGATVGDADGDGDIEICMMVTSTPTAYINLFTLDSIPFKGYLAPYFTWFQDRWNTGWIHPAPPESLTLDVPILLYGMVKVEWPSNGEPDILGYHIYRSLIPGGPYERLTTTPWEDTVYFDMTAIEDTMNYYAVSAVIRAGAESYLSEEDSIVPVGVTEQDEGSQEPRIMCTTITTGHVEIAFSNLSPSKQHMLEVYDVAGRKLKQWTIMSTSGTYTLHVHPGVYFVRLNGCKVSMKVIAF